MAVTAWGIWKNHNFTDAANAAQQFLNAAKANDFEEAADIDADDEEDAQPAGTDGGEE